MGPRYGMKPQVGGQDASIWLLLLLLLLLLLPSPAPWCCPAHLAPCSLMPRPPPPLNWRCPV
jgi:hypothetical protein